MTTPIHPSESRTNQKVWLEHVLNQLPIGLSIIERPASVIIFMNDVASKLLGIPPHEAQKPVEVRKYVHLFDVNGVALPFDRYPSERAGRGEMIQNETLIMKTLERQFYITVSAHQLTPLSGHSDTIAVIFNDVTEKIQSEIALRESRMELEISEARLRLAIEASHLGFWSIDRDTREVEWSEIYQKMFDLPEGSRIGHQSEGQSRIHPDDRERVTHEINECLKLTDVFRSVYRVVRRDGTIAWIEGHGRIMDSGDGRRNKVQGTCIDVTELKVAQEELKRAKEVAEKASAAKSQFIANMSHEIRTPLTAIMGFTQLLTQRGVDESDRKTYIDAVLRNGNSLTSLIDDILDIAKAEAGIIAVETSPFSVIDLVEDVVSNYRELLKKKNVSLHVQLDPHLPRVVRTDFVRFRQILSNVFGNAVKFTERGDVWLRVRCFQIEASAPWTVEVEVEDSGIGMTLEESQRIFAPFVQADESTSRRFGGTGLGLALSRRIARALGGDVTLLQSRPGVGSLFRISILLESVAHDGVDRDQEAEPLSEFDLLKDLRILLVEDAPDNSLMISNMLQYHGAEVDCAMNGLQGVECALKTNYDIVLMDLQMPLMDGFQALRELQKQSFAKPVLALTAHAMPEEKVRTKEAGFVAHVTKPIDPGILIGTIRRLVGR